MAYKINLVPLDPNAAKVVGSEYAIENKENGCIYITTKPYIDQLFKLMGYRNLGVVKILEEFADKTISQIGDIKEYSLFIDDTTQSFVVTRPESVKWVKDLLTFLNDNEFEVTSLRADTCYNWDQLIIKSPSGSYFALYIDLLWNNVQVVALDYDGCVLNGLMDEGGYDTTGGEETLNSLILLIMSPVDISSEFTPTQKLSAYEYVELLKSLGYVSRKKRKYYKTDNADEVIGYIGNLDDVLDDINSQSWLQQRVRPAFNNATFANACKLISLSLDDIPVWKFRDFYMNNARELSDFFALNY